MIWLIFCYIGTGNKTFWEQVNLTLSAPTPQIGHTHSNNLLAKTDELFECVWPYCGVGAKKVKGINSRFFHKVFWYF